LKQKIVITGANGMLGSALCKVYYGNNSVYALHRDKECFGICTKDYSFDLTDSTKLKSCLDQIKPDLVIHCAGLINLELCEQHPQLAYDANVNVSENIAKWCSSQAAKLVYISTDQVYGGSKDHSETNTNLQPLNQYGETKLQGELKVQELSADSIIVRTNIFGWNIKPTRFSSVEWICNSLENEEEVTLFTDYTFSPIYTKELANIIMKLVNLDFSGIINIGSPKTCTKYEFGMQLEETFGFDQSLIRKGTIKDHKFKALRSNDLSLPIEKIDGLALYIPDFQSSIKSFYNDRHEHLAS